MRHDPRALTAALACVAALAVGAAPAAAQRSHSTDVPITAASLDAYIRGTRAERAERHRVDSLREVATSTPPVLRMGIIASCTESRTKATPGAVPTHDQMVSDSVRGMKQLASLDTNRMKALAERAQRGDAAAMAQLQAMSMQMARQQAMDPATIARAQQAQQQGMMQLRIREQCERSAPSEAAAATMIAAAQREVRQYGQSDSDPSYEAHLTSVRLRAAGGMSPAQFAALNERIMAYVEQSRSGHAPRDGFSASELALLNAHRAELQSLNELLG